MTRNVMYPIKKEPYQEPVTKPAAPPNGAEWRCPSCNQDLFGKFRDGQLHVKYREREMMVNGTVTVVCRRCGFQASLDTRDYPYPVNVVVALPGAPEDNSTLVVSKKKRQKKQPESTK